MRFRRSVGATGLAILSVGLVLVAAAAMQPADARARGPKRDAVREIIVHATGGPFCRGGTVVFSPAGTLPALKRFFEASRVVSIHYIVDRDGTIARSVPETEVAVHTIGRNDSSIGIELINAGDGRDPYPPAQITALVTLIDGIRRRWGIPLGRIHGHDGVDQTTFACAGRQVRRKQDPGPLFPWDRFKMDLLLAEKP